MLTFDTWFRYPQFYLGGRECVWSLVADQVQYTMQFVYLVYDIYIAFDKLDGCCLSSLDDMMSSHNDPDIKGQAVLHMLACSLGDLRYCTMIYVLTI